MDVRLFEQRVVRYFSTYEGAGKLLRFYEDGLHGYTYLEG